MAEKSKGKGWKLNWRGEEVVEEVLENLVVALGEIGLRVEGEAKKELRPGHGVRTGTLRRSIHTAEPGYNWVGDDVSPEEGSISNMGGVLSNAKRKNGKLVVEVGSGLHYAILVHQGHDGFEGYHYLTNAVDKVKPKVKGIVERHALK